MMAHGSIGANRCSHVLTSGKMPETRTVEAVTVPVLAVVLEQLLYH